jgi:cytochrome oxidase assembly protein ShyY1
MGGMSGRLLNRRIAALTLLAVVLVVTFVLLGAWQLSRADAFLGHAPDPAPVELSEVAAPTGPLASGAVGRRVTVTGTYDGEHGFVVPDRAPGGGAGRGFWVVGLLRLPDGSGVCVVRGWTASTNPDVRAGPTGTVTVSGRLAASEPADGGRPPGSPLPAGQLAAVNPVNLLDTVAYPVHDGFVIASPQSPPGAAALTPVHADPPGTAVPGFFLQHVGYVGLWWLFAVFVVAFWIRVVVDELRGETVPLVGSGGPGEPG